MPTPLDRVAKQISDSLLGVLGTTADITRRTVGSYDPETQTESGISTATVTAKAAPPESYNSHEIDDTTVRADDKRIYVDAASVNSHASFTHGPKPEDQIKLNNAEGETFRIVSVKALRSGEDVYGYEIQGRK